MNLMTMIVGTVVLTIIQISILRSLPRKLLGIIAMVPIVGTVANFVASSSIAVFTGAGTYVGMMNMTSSVFVMFWLVGYQKYYQPRLVWKRHWLGISVPRLTQSKRPSHWLFG